jgi:hypothetical protein
MAMREILKISHFRVRISGPFTGEKSQGQTPMKSVPDFEENAVTLWEFALYLGWPSDNRRTGLVSVSLNAPVLKLSSVRLAGARVDTQASLHDPVLLTFGRPPSWELAQPSKYY